MLFEHRGADAVVRRAWQKRQTDDIWCAVASVGMVINPPVHRRWRIGFWTDSKSSLSSAASSVSDGEGGDDGGAPRQRLVVDGT